jgi:hypothetical protein
MILDAERAAARLKSRKGKSRQGGGVLPEDISRMLFIFGAIFMFAFKKPQASHPSRHSERL